MRIGERDMHNAPITKVKWGETGLEVTLDKDRNNKKEYPGETSNVDLIIKTEAFNHQIQATTD